MQNFNQTLKFLGLSKEEIKIYLICLEYGELSIANIANLSKVGRVNCYHHTDKLVKKGFLNTSQKNKIKTFSAENPQIFINKEKEKLNIAQELVPQLLAISNQGQNKPKIQFFEGIYGIKNIFSKLLEVPNTEIVSFSNFETLDTFFKNSNFLKEHFSSRLKKQIKTRFISPRNETTENFRQKIFPKKFDRKLLEIFLISPEEFFFESEITIFTDSIAILNLKQTQPIGVLIQNPELFRTQKAIFDLAWLGATSFITR